MERRLCGEDEYPVPLLSIAGHGLPGARRSFPSGTLDDEAWSTLLAAAVENRVTGLLHIATGDEVLPATATQRQQARAAHRRMQLRVLGLEHHLADVVDVLEEGGVDARILKGSAVAHLDYANPAIRSFIDLDVLVRGADFDRSVELLTRAGFRRTLAEPRPGFDRRFDKGTTLVAPAGFELDLHRTFVLGPWGAAMDPDQLWDEGEPVRIGARTFRALRRTHRFLHACYHAALGNWPLRLASLRDVAEQLRAGQDECEVLEVASAWRAQALVAAAVADSRRLLGTSAADALTEWAARYRPTYGRSHGWRFTRGRTRHSPLRHSRRFPCSAGLTASRTSARCCAPPPLTPRAGTGRPGSGWRTPSGRFVRALGARDAERRIDEPRATPRSEAGLAAAGVRVPRWSVHPRCTDR